MRSQVSFETLVILVIEVLLVIASIYAAFTYIIPMLSVERAKLEEFLQQTIIFYTKYY